MNEVPLSQVKTKKYGGTLLLLVVPLQHICTTPPRRYERLCVFACFSSIALGSSLALISMGGYRVIIYLLAHLICLRQEVTVSRTVLHERGDIAEKAHRASALALDSQTRTDGSDFV